MTKSRTIERLVRLGIHGEPFGYVDGPNKYQFVKGNPVNYPKLRTLPRRIFFHAVESVMAGSPGALILKNRV